MTHFVGRKYIYAMGACALALSTTFAHAQEEAAPAAPAASEDDGGIRDIVVTARRRNESIQTTPVAVTAIAPSTLEGAAAVNISDLQGAAPNVLITVQATGAATANISIRGIAFADVEKSFDPAVGVNVDGVYIGTSTGQFLDFFDIESIEILRGPQGTLFGRNTISGVINVRRTRPTGEFGGKFEASYGKYDQFGARAVLNVPIIPDKLAAKFFEFHTDGPGFYRNFYTGRREGGANNENFGASFLFTPSENFDALLTLEKQVQDFNPVVSALSRTGDIFCLFAPAIECDRNVTDDLYTTFGQTPGRGRYRSPAATLEMNLDAGGVKLTSVTSYRKSREAQLQDVDAFSANLYVFDRRQKYHQFSQEFRASGQITDSFDYVAGLYYFKSKYNLVQFTSVFGSPLAQTQDTTGKSESYAAFVDFNWEIFDRVRLSGGGRYTHDKKQNLNPGIVGGESASNTWSKFTPKIALDYRPTDDLMVYGSWSRGYRSGGFNGRGLTILSATTPYDPETVDAYEIGFKSEFWDRKIALNVAAFYTDYKGIQQSSTIPLTVPPFNETIVTNAGGAKIKGVEADLTIRPTRELTIRSSMGYTDSKFRNFLVGQLVGGELRTFDFSNVDLIYAPKLTASISAEYSTPIDLGKNGAQLKLSAGYRYLSRYDQQIAAPGSIKNGIVPGSTDIIVVPNNDPRLRSDKQNLVDGSISIIFNMDDDKAKARLTFFGRNLLDDRGTQTAFTVAAPDTLWGFAAAREPRTYGVQVGFEF